MNEILLPSSNFGLAFEEEVKAFLESLNFLDIKGGNGFHIAAEGESNQIDVSGRYGDILFVFECTAAGRLMSKDLRDKILVTKDKARMAFENYRKIPEYSKCKVIKFIFITKKIQIPEVQKELCKNSHMWYANEDLLEYYLELHDKIGQYAVYSFLADFEVYPSEQEKLQVMSLKSRIGPYNIYNFFVKPKELLKYAYVARRRALKEEFYQRMLDKSRIKKIQNFLDDGGIFPTSVVVSLKGGDREFKKIDYSGEQKNFESEVGILTIKNSYDACWIVDGQHRLYSFAKSKSEKLISCVAFDGINIEDERRFFLEINKEQKPIPPDLIWDLEGLSNPDTPRGIISIIVRTLNKKETFIGKIYIPANGSKKDKLINMAAFCNGILNSSLTRNVLPNLMGKENPLFDQSAPKMAVRVSRVLDSYFDNLKLDIKDSYFHFLFGNAGIPIMLYVLEPIISFLRRSPNAGDFQEFTKVISHFFEKYYPTSDEVKKLKTEVNSEGARKNLARKIGSHIRSELGYKDFWPTMEEEEFVKDIIEMERRLGNLIKEELSQIATNWENKRVPQPIYQSAKKVMEYDGTLFEENFSLGDELQIIIRKDNWDEVFKEIFITKDGFKNQSELEIGFRYLSDVRNPASHGKQVIPSKEALDLCEVYLQRFSRIAPEIITEYPDLE